LPETLAGKTGTPLRGILTSFMFAPKRGKAKSRRHGGGSALLLSRGSTSALD
jgi:hypothetical protein